MITTVIYTARVVAEAINPADNAAMISITTPNHKVASLKPGFKWILRLCFHDVEDLLPGVRSFTEIDAVAVIDFLAKVEEDEIKVLIVHCDAGLSRSAAIARFIADSRTIEDFNLDRSILYNRKIYSMLLKAAFDFKAPPFNKGVI